MMPDAAQAIWNGLRPCVGTLDTISFARICERLEVSVWSSETCSLTVTLCDRSPTSSATSMRLAVPTCRTMSLRRTFLKPDASTVNSYVPGLRTDNGQKVIHSW